MDRYIIKTDDGRTVAKAETPQAVRERIREHIAHKLDKMLMFSPATQTKEGWREYQAYLDEQGLDVRFEIVDTPIPKKGLTKKIK